MLGNITLALRHVHRMGRREADAAALRPARTRGLTDKAQRHPDRLSGGQQQRVAIARAIATSPDLLLLDEITSALDPELVGEVLDLVRELADDGMTIVMATHEMAFARDVADRVVFLDAGRDPRAGLARRGLRRSARGAHPRVPRALPGLNRAVRARFRARNRWR